MPTGFSLDAACSTRASFERTCREIRLEERRPIGLITERDVNVVDRKCLDILQEMLCWACKRSAERLERLTTKATRKRLGFRPGDLAADAPNEGSSVRKVACYLASGLQLVAQLNIEHGLVLRLEARFSRLSLFSFPLRTSEQDLLIE